MPTPTKVTDRHHIDRRSARLVAEAAGSDPHEVITEIELAEWLGVSRGWLQAGRKYGWGPVYFRAGRSIRYLRRDVIAWLEERRAVAERVRAEDRQRAMADRKRDRTPKRERRQRPKIIRIDPEERARE